MCRLFVLKATAPTKVGCPLVRAENSLVVQSRSDRSGQCHNDGWGIGYYNDGEPHVIRRATSAAVDPEFLKAAQNVCAKTTIAHIRAGSVGALNLVNTHPFRYEHWLFAHNGTITAFDIVAPRMLAELAPEFADVPRGSTDSELAFHWILSRMIRADLDIGRTDLDVHKIAGVVADAIGTIARWCEAEFPEEPAAMNFFLTDGERMVASRWNRTLYTLEREGHMICEICGGHHAESSPLAGYRSIAIASEPVTTAHWTEVPERTVIAIDPKVHSIATAI